MERKLSDTTGVPLQIPKEGIGGGTRENQIVVYQPNDTMHLDVRLENETVWLTQEQMALLFGRDQSVIARHVGNIFKEGELSRDSVYAKNAYTASDGKTYQVAFYNLDVVISVGYRVKSVQGTRFRQWATGVRGAVDRVRETFAAAHGQLGDGRDAGPLREEAHGRESDDLHVGAL